MIAIEKDEISFNTYNFHYKIYGLCMESIDIMELVFYDYI